MLTLIEKFKQQSIYEFNKCISSKCFQIRILPDQFSEYYEFIFTLENEQDSFPIEIKSLSDVLILII